MSSRSSASRTDYAYQALPGYFLQSDPATNNHNFDVFNGVPNLGLVSQDWEKLKQEVVQLNQNAKANEHYKFLAVNRHGQGFHNVAKLLYGDDMWDCHWSMQYGDNNFTWAPDPHLTEQGLAEAEIARKGWVRELNLGAPLPQSFYSSPLSRSASTMQITWSEHLKPGQTIVVKEGWRETIGLHTCDQRSTKSHLAKTYTGFTFEEGFVEEDELWTQDGMETDDLTVYRVWQALDDLFDHDNNTFIAISAHAGLIRCLLKAVNHREFFMTTGGMIPLVLKMTSDGPMRERPSPELIPAPACPKTPSSK